MRNASHILSLLAMRAFLIGDLLSFIFARRSSESSVRSMVFSISLTVSAPMPTANSEPNWSSLALYSSSVTTWANLRSEVPGSLTMYASK